MAAASFSFMAESDGLEGPVNAFFNQVSSLWSPWKVAGAADFYLVFRDILRDPWLSRQSGRDESAMGVHTWGGLPPPLSVVSILLAVARTPEELRVRCGTQDSGPFRAPNVMWPERWQRLVPQISYRKGLATGPEYTIISTLRFLFSFQCVIGCGMAFLFLNPLMWILLGLYLIFGQAVVDIYHVLFPGPILYLGVICLLFVVMLLAVACGLT